MLAPVIDALRPRLDQSCHERAYFRVHVGFQDVDILSALHGQAAAAAAHPHSDSSEAEIRRYFDAGRAADALHRALIEAAHRAMTVLLHECAGRPSKEVNVAKQLASPKSTQLHARAAWQGLYCLGVFRNKIIVHHDVPRMLSAMTETDGTRRLLPMPEDFHIDRTDAARIREIRDTSGIATSLDNDFQLLEALFYELPVSFGTAPSVARREINVIAERGGVKSPSVANINAWLAGAFDDVAALLADSTA